MSEPRSNTPASTPPETSQKATSSRKRQEKPTQKTRPEESLPGRVVSLTAIDRDGMISMAAYYRAEQRNFIPGFELEDWLAAEAEIDALLLRSAETDTTPPV